MNTELTKQNDEAVIRGWIFYDAECSFCVRVRNRIGPVFEYRGFCWLPLQSTAAATMLGLGATEAHDQMRLLLADGRVSGGVAAWATLCREVWWLWPVGVAIGLPGLNSVSRGVYRWIARNRYCFAGSCEVRKGNQ